MREDILEQFRFTAALRRAPTCLFRFYNIITLSTSHLYAEEINSSLPLANRACTLRGKQEVTHAAPF
jgi:hypothetical protein